MESTRVYAVPNEGEMLLYGKRGKRGTPAVTSSCGDLKSTFVAMKRDTVKVMMNVETG